MEQQEMNELQEDFAILAHLKVSPVSQVLLTVPQEVLQKQIVLHAQLVNTVVVLLFQQKQEIVLQDIIVKLVQLFQLLLPLIKDTIQEQEQLSKLYEIMVNIILFQRKVHVLIALLATIVTKKDMMKILKTVQQVIIAKLELSIQQDAQLVLSMTKQIKIKSLIVKIAHPVITAALKAYQHLLENVVQDTSVKLDLLFNNP
jgi:hypothetical protein